MKNKLLILVCAFAQLLNAQSGSTGSLQGAKKHDFHHSERVQKGSNDLLFFTDSGNPIIQGGNGKKSDLNIDTGGSSGGTVVGGTQDPLGKKKDLAVLGEPILKGTKKQDFSQYESGGNGAVLGNGGKKQDYCWSGNHNGTGGGATVNGKKFDFAATQLESGGGTGVSSGSTTHGYGDPGKKSDLYLV